MTLLNTKEMLKKASREGYAVPAFNFHNLETALTIVEAAVESKSPLILAASPSTVAYAGLDYVYAIAKTAAKTNRIPIALHLDHHESLEAIKPALKLGVKSVMIDASAKSYEENIALTKKIVKAAGYHQASVEAELGRVAGTKQSEDDSGHTDPDLARDFIKQTGIDSLAIAIGTGHGVYESEPKLDFDRLAAIKEKVDIPLVLHGASGLSEEDLRECIRLGIAKVNVSTEFKIPFTKSLRNYLNQHQEETDLRVYMKEAMKVMKEVAIQKIHTCGSNNQA